MKEFIYKEGIVFVSDSGIVFKNGNPVSLYNNGLGYITFILKGKHFYVHRIVCLLYHGEPKNNKMQANHLNGIKNDNRAVNLRWDTSSDNHKHAWRELGRVHAKNQRLKTGANHQRSKPVDQLDIDTGEIIRTHPSLVDAAKFIGVTKDTIFKYLRKTENNVGKGFKWGYSKQPNMSKNKYIYYTENGTLKRKLNK